MPFKALNKKDLTLLTSKRSQSALEYMMTYGWAILIIVIVAVILYSMGIFNPSSSITFTSSGFSPFTVSSSLCNNIGYKIAVLAGPIPNNANSLTINKVYLTSATGANTTTASYTLTNPVTLKSGQSATILIPNVACNSANIHYSLSAKIQYSYTASTLGLQNVNTTGTVAGTSITGKPSTLTSYEPITITNSQSSATPSPFQQMVNFTSSDPGFSSIATGNFGQNVEFFYYNGTVIPSWLESYTGSNALWWLKVAAIPGGSSETVYVGFAPTTTNLFNTVNDGEAPQLSSTYAEYDDGNNVFINYDNFANLSETQRYYSFPTSDTSIAGLLEVYANDNYSFSDGLTMYNTTYSTSREGNGMINGIQSLFTINYSKYVEMSYISMNPGNAWGSVVGAYAGYIQGYDRNELQDITQGVTLYTENLTVQAGSPLIQVTMPQLFQLYHSPYNTTSYYYVNNKWYNFIGEGFLPNYAVNWMQFFIQTNDSNFHIYYAMIRNLPPDTIMPSVSFGGLYQ
jgi:hypothetical protein